MSEDLATLQARLAAIRKARDSGVLMITHGDVTTRFRDLAEMDRIIAGLTAEIAGLQGTSRRKVRYLYQSGKGL